MTRARPAEPETLPQLTDGVAAQPPGSPTATAFRRALRRKGEAIAGLAVPGGLAAAVSAVALAPDRAEARRNELAAAWAGLV